MNKIQISAEVIADSLSPKNERLISILCTGNLDTLKTILSEHKDLSVTYTDINKIEFKELVKVVQDNPFIPIAWQKHHSGMQGTEYLTNKEDIKNEVLYYLFDRDEAVKRASARYKRGVTKQICNRYLEPFMWTTMLITGSKEGWDNFFHLRCPQYLLYSEQIPIYFKSKKDLLKYVHKIETDEFKEQYDNLTNLEWLLINEGQAEIHIMMLSEKIYDAFQESVPRKLEEGEWHIPMIEVIKD
jgi:hypothetical protein